jgi:predicted porin
VPTILRNTHFCMAAASLAVAAPAIAQSSVTLYGIVDDTITYQSSQSSLGSNSGGRSNVKMASGVWAGNRFGFTHKSET